MAFSIWINTLFDLKRRITENPHNQEPKERQLEPTTEQLTKTTLPKIQENVSKTHNIATYKHNTTMTYNLS